MPVLGIHDASMYDRPAKQGGQLTHPVSLPEKLKSAPLPTGLPEMQVQLRTPDTGITGSVDAWEEGAGEESAAGRPALWMIMQRPAAAHAHAQWIKLWAL